MAIIDGSIQCRRCGLNKPVASFRPSVVSKGSGYCRDCCGEYLRSYRDDNPEKFRAYFESRDPEKTRRNQRTYAEKLHALPRGEQQEARRRHHLWHRYGLTAASYDAMLASQDGACACCGGRETKQSRSRNMHVDHDHLTGAVRGLICNQCNLGIGALGDSIEGVSRALDYLQRARKTSSQLPAMRINLLKVLGG